MSRDLRRHADLVDRMADRLGVGLEDAMMSRRLAPGALADAVLECAACPDPGQCEDWLARAEALGDRPKAAPGYCRNADLMARLRP